MCCRGTCGRSAVDGAGRPEQGIPSGLTNIGEVLDIHEEPEVAKSALGQETKEDIGLRLRAVWVIFQTLLSRVIAFDTDTGKVLANLPCAGVLDDMSYDAAHKRIYVTGDGTTSVFQQRDADHYEHIAEIPTGFQGKTSLFVPELNRLYVELSGKAKPEAKLALMIFLAQP